MLHECCHVYLFHNGYEDYDQHDERFNKLAKRVCDVYIGLDVKEF
jgi:predicted SprT family Zn-dependent metalloprotease